MSYCWRTKPDLNLLQEPSQLVTLSARPRAATRIHAFGCPAPTLVAVDEMHVSHGLAKTRSIKIKPGSSNSLGRRDHVMQDDMHALLNLNDLTTSLFKHMES